MQMHIQVACTVLKRPIILLDGNTTDHTLLFLPLLNPSLCRRNVGGDLSSPLVLCFANERRDYFVPVLSYSGCYSQKLRERLVKLAHKTFFRLL